MKSKWKDFQSILADSIRNFIQYKRALGRKYKTEEHALRLFDSFLVEQDVTDTTQITPMLIEVFLASRSRPRPRSFNHLLGVIRCFFDWLVTQGLLLKSPVRLRSRRVTSRHIPFLFDLDLFNRFLARVALLPDNPRAYDRAKTYTMIFSLLYGLGLRVGEVSRLCRKDVDFDRQLLIIRETKFSKNRLVPFGPRLGQRLADFLACYEATSGGLQPDDPIFSFGRDKTKPLSPNTITQAFHHLVVQLDLKIPPGVSHPRLHDLRHSFAVRTLLRWYHAGIAPGQRLIHLSTFLGHTDPTSTAWYLTITTDLLDAANQRFERFAPMLHREIKP